MKNRKAPILLIVLLSLILLGMPIMLIPLLFIGLYIRWFKAGDFTPLLNRLQRIDNTKLFIACGLTLASLLIIYQQTTYATKFGYPSPIVTYYSYPATPGVTVIVGPLWSRLAIDLFAASLDVVSYYLLLSLIQWIYRRGILWLGGNDAVTG